MYRILLFAALATIGIDAQGAITTTIDFDDLSQSGDVATPLATYSFDGYTFDNNTASTLRFETYGDMHDNYAGSTALSPKQVNSISTLSRSDTTEFDLISIDIARLSPSVNDPSTPVTFTDMTFTGVLAGGGIVTNKFTFSVNDNEFEELTFSGFSSVTSVSWGQNSPFHQFDNVVVQVTAVPEPTSLAFLAVGLGVVGVRRVRSTRFAHAPA